MDRITEVPRGQTTEWSRHDRSFTVDRELNLHIANGVLGYETFAVAPYEKTYPPSHKLSDQGVSFAIHNGARIVAQIDLSKGWNGFARIENLFVARESRRQGLARALIQRAFTWAKTMRYPGVMLETQSSNVTACQLYESCGFELLGFDSGLYRGLEPPSQEVALFWYWRTQVASAP